MEGKTEKWTPWALLFGAMFMAYLASGDRPLEMAAWIYPFFLLRFIMIHKPGKGLLLAYAPMATALYLATRGMTPLPPVAFAFSMLISTLYILLPYWLTRLLHRHVPAALSTLVFPVFMTAFDYLGAQGPWGSWGLSVYSVSNLALLQLVSVTGIWGVGFVMAWTASVGNAVWDRQKDRVNNPLTITWAGVLVMIMAFGLIRLAVTPKGRPVKAAGVMLSLQQMTEFNEAVLPLASDSLITGEQKAGIRALAAVMADSLFERSCQIEDDVELLMWNEAALPVFLADADSLLIRIGNLARQRQMSIAATVAVLNDDLSQGLRQAIHNRLLLVDQSGTVRWQYAKSVLVPGPESYISQPGDSVLPVADLDAGRISGAICYEMDFPGYIRQAGQQKAALLLAPANDWPAIKRTHARMARIRAIENGTALFRVASQGVSQSVDALGRVVSSWDFFKDRGIYQSEVRAGHVPSLYVRVGDWLARLAILVSGTLILWGSWKGAGRWRVKK